MEVAIEDRLPTFSGGLGVLAGDVLRAAADMGLTMVGVTLLYRHGFFRQGIDAQGRQSEHSVDWQPSEVLHALPERVSLSLGGRRVVVRPWRLVLHGVEGHQVPVLFLDTDLAENHPADRTITDRLYMGDLSQRLSQEVVLGIGGPLVLEALGYRGLSTHHMNEGHAALVPVGLATQVAGHRQGGRGDQGPPASADWSPEQVEALGSLSPEDLDQLRRRCAFTTHTPVPAGHDRFSPTVVDQVLGDQVPAALGALGALEDDGTLNMTKLGMFFSHFVNGVSLRHRQVSSEMFPDTSIEVVTNGVHTASWAAPATASLFDRHLPGWRRDATGLRYAASIPVDQVRAAHHAAKAELIAEVHRRAAVRVDPGVFTLGVARRATAYKRNDLVLSDPSRLAEIAERAGPIQILYAGKAHPADEAGRDMIHHVNQVAAKTEGSVVIVYLADYGLSLARLLCAGVDVWLNTPARPHEASGTSGMKAAVNGVPSLSTLDGWWLEGHFEGVTGWAVGPDDPGRSDAAADAEDLYRVLETTVVPLYYRDPGAMARVGRNAMALNASFFSAQRMVGEYRRRAYGAPGDNGGVGTR